MATATKKTAMVYNPSRALTVRKTNASPVKKTKKSRTNPAVKKVVNASSHRRKRPIRRNPSGITGLIAAAFMAGLGVWGFDVLTNKFMPNGSTPVRIGVKLGAAYLLQSNYGSKIPFLGKYKNDIALVLAVAAVVDALQAYVLPTVSNLTGGLLNLGGGQTVNMIPAGEDGMGGEYYTAEFVDDSDGDDWDY